MTYYLMGEVKRGEYSVVDITKSSRFRRLSKLKGNDCELFEIDMFTMNFSNEIELRKHLIEEGILIGNIGNNRLSIRRKDNNGFKRVSYGFLYQKDIKYIEDPNKLINRVLNKLYSGDFKFVRDFAYNYVHCNECSSTMPEVRHFAEESMEKGYISNGFSMVDENGDMLFRRALKLLIYKYEQKKNGKIVYSDKVVYRNLHSILCYINNYDKKQTDKLEKNDAKTLKRVRFEGEQLKFL